MTCPSATPSNATPATPHVRRRGGTVSRLLRRVRRVYELHCAREDARVRGIVVPLGVWVCNCEHVSLDRLAFVRHLGEVHA